MGQPPQYRAGPSRPRPESAALRKNCRIPLPGMPGWKRSVLVRAGCCSPGDAAEHGAGSEPGASGIVEIEQSADQLAGGIKAADGLVIGIENFAIGSDAQPAERKGHTASHRISLEWRLIDGVCPVALVHEEALGAAPILDVRIEGDIAAHRLVVFGYSCEELLGVDAVELA